MRKRVIFLKMSLLLVCLSVRAQAVMPAHVSIDILGFDTYNGVAIACKHNPHGSFQATHAFAPDPRVETIISFPVLKWTISPATDVSLNPPAGTDTATVDVKMENDAAYGKEYSVTVTATWKVRMTATGEECNVEDKATVKLAAIKLTDFTVISTGLSLGGEHLTDNRKGLASITVPGIADPSGFSFVFTATPVETSPINKMGTAISFTPTQNRLIYNMSTTYWYGTPVECCYTNHHAYKFDLTMNKCCKLSKTYKVGWPSEVSPVMIPNASDNSKTVIHPSEPEPGVYNWYRCQIVFGGFEKTYQIIGLPVSNQYADEMATEENYHKRQWLGEVSDAEGGQGDILTAKGVQYYSGFTGAGPFYCFGSTPEIAFNEASRKVMAAELMENKIAKEIFYADRGFIELKAKAFTGYNAAFKYHCCYEKTFGENPVNKHHPAFPVTP